MLGDSFVPDFAAHRALQVLVNGRERCTSIEFGAEQIADIGIWMKMSIRLVGASSSIARGRVSKYSNKITSVTGKSSLPCAAS